MLWRTFREAVQLRISPAPSKVDDVVFSHVTTPLVSDSWIICSVTVPLLLTIIV